MLKKGLLLAVAAWLLQSVLILPLAIYGMHLSEHAEDAYFAYSFKRTLYVYGFICMDLLPSSILMIISGNMLSKSIYPWLRYIKFLQPTILVGLVFCFSGAAGSIGGILFASMGYLYIFIYNKLTLSLRRFYYNNQEIQRRRPK